MECENEKRACSKTRGCYESSQDRQSGLKGFEKGELKYKVLLEYFYYESTLFHKDVLLSKM